MSTNFLQRFKGKTNQIGKDGVNDILGAKHNNLYHTNISSYSKAPSLKPLTENMNISTKTKQSTSELASINTFNVKKQRRKQNPFFVANPFHMDEEEKQKSLIEWKDSERNQEKRKLAKIQQNHQEKRKSSEVSKGIEKKNNERGWSKLGGLGANIGGDQWLEKKKKTQKIQEFSAQVKSINAERKKSILPELKRQKPKATNSRQKMLQYSKNVPKPIIKRDEISEEHEQAIEIYEQQMSELKRYEMKHQQLRKILFHQH